MKKMMILLIVTMIAFLPGCTGEGSQSGTVDVRGEITQISEGNGKDILSVILVEGILEEDSKVDKARVSITKKTDILVMINQNKQEKADYTSLQEGQTVEVIFTGLVRESYPVQASAQKVIIRSTENGQGKNLRAGSLPSAENVHLNLDKEVYNSKDTMKLTIFNNNTSPIAFGRPFQIEQLKDGKWSEYPLDLAFTLELILLEPGKKFEQIVSLESFEKGRYRIFKNLSIEDSQIELRLVREFEVQ
jgi:hypothetical protein